MTKKQGTQRVKRRRSVKTAKKRPRVTIKKRSTCVCVFSVVNRRKIEGGTLFSLSAKYARDIVDLNRATYVTY